LTFACKTNRLTLKCTGPSHNKPTLKALLPG